MTRKNISSGSPFEEQIGYSRAVVQDGWVFVSGTTGYDYDKMEMPEDVVEQCRNTFRNIETALAEAGASLQDVVRACYILPVREDYAKCFPVIKETLGDVRPAMTHSIAGLMYPEMKIEIEVTAKLPG